MEAGAAVQVRVVESRLLKPVRPSPEKIMFFNPLDLMPRHFPHNRRFLFYELHSLEEYAGFVHALLSSLPEVLSAFYPLAGRFEQLRQPEPGVSSCSTSRPLLRLVCNDEGAEFIEAVVEGVSFDQVQRSGFPHQSFYSNLVPWIDPANDYCVAPPLIIQVSRFECGSVALAVAHSHIVCDGHSLWHFMTSWAECARGMAISSLPIHSRELLNVDCPSSTKAMLLLSDDGHLSERSSVQEDMKMMIFHFTREMVLTLKKRTGGLSSYESLCAHLWKHTNKVKGYARDEKVSFVTVINMRRRMRPPLGDNYFGNGAIWTNVVATSGEIQDEDLRSIANRIHASIISCTESTMPAWIHWLEVYDRDAILAKASLQGTRLRVSSSPNFPIFDVDFGWGKPLVARCASMEGEGKVILYPGRGGHGSIDVSIALPTNIMQRLESDISFVNP